MDAQQSRVPFKDAAANGRNFLLELIKNDVPVIAVNQETRKSRALPFKSLFEHDARFWQKGGSFEYFLEQEDFVRIRDIVLAAQAEQQVTLAPKAEPVLTGPVLTEAEAPASQTAVEEALGSEYEKIVSQSIEARVETLQEWKKSLDALAGERPRPEAPVVTEALVDAATDAALINHATLINAMQVADTEAKKLTQSLVDSTQDLVRSTIRITATDLFNDELVNTLVAKSNGTVIQHMTRVYLQGLAFLSYYNALVSSSSFIQKLRISFEKKYRNYYAPLLSWMDPGSITLEKIFRGGMRVIPESDFFTWATGFLIHDVGKAAAVEYHEGEAAYNRDIVVEHVKVGYNEINNKTNYPREAALITGYHHEYYGDPSGYGYFRAWQEQYIKENPRFHPEYVIAWEINPILKYEALSYFPSKVLEIIDVYDSVTDPNRKYRKAMQPEEALAMMREEFIVKHLKIDPILFDIFSAFIRGR